MRKDLTPVAIKVGRTLLNDYSMEKSIPNGLYKYPNRCLFPHPAIGTVGLTEEEAQQTCVKRISKSILLDLLPCTLPCNPTDRQQAKFKPITAGPEERVVGLHGLATESMNDPRICSCYQMERQPISTQPSPFTQIGSGRIL